MTLSSVIRQANSLAIVLMLVVSVPTHTVFGGEFRCGAAAVDVSPRSFPVIRNGGFLEATDDRLDDPLHARCLVCDDGQQKIAIVVVDSCMIPLQVCDRAKQLAAQETGIARDRILISATHTHSAPSVMDYCLGSRADPVYREFLPAQIAAAVQRANERLVPAKLGATRIDATGFTHCRRWVTRSDALQIDPFGLNTVHANMHPGHQNPNFLGPSGPVDPWLSLVMVRTLDDQPLAALANLSMHYYGGHPGISADFCGRFANAFAAANAPDAPDFVAIMSQGTSGDLWWGDYRRAADNKPFSSLDDFTKKLVGLANRAAAEIQFTSEVPVKFAEHRMTLRRRVPSPERLKWAQSLNQQRGDRQPKNRPEVYAMQAQHLHENPNEEVVLQAARLGPVAIAAMPNEVYALTGLKIKYQSPVPLTFNISLANGASGYIPPPEQHRLGGYTTWPATTAGLEVMAEPKIVDQVLALLESVSGNSRVAYTEQPTAFSRYVLSTKPVAYWRMADFNTAEMQDATEPLNQLRAEGSVAFHLPGRTGKTLGDRLKSHATLLAGGRLVPQGLELKETFTAQFAFNLAIPTDTRETTAVLLDRGTDQLAITGTAHSPGGRLRVGNTMGETPIERGRWHHVIFVRNGDFVEVFLDGKTQPEVSTKVDRKDIARQLYFGCDAQLQHPFEGKLDEISVYDRALTKGQVRELFGAAGYGNTDEVGKLDSTALSPQESLASIHIREGYAVELVAAEPLVKDPVAIDWGPDGKLWVAEMADYPMGMDN